MNNEPMFYVKFILTYTIFSLVIQYKLISFPFRLLYFFSEYCIDNNIKI